MKESNCSKFIFCLFSEFVSCLLLQIVEEAGGTVTRMDGGKFCVFDRSILVSNGALHEKVSYCCFSPPQSSSEYQHLFASYLGADME